MLLCSYESHFLNWDPVQLQLLHKHLDSLLNPQPVQPSEEVLASHKPPPRKSYASFFSPMAISHPPALPPPAWKDGKLTLRIPQQMVKTSSDSFSFSAIGKFVGRRLSLEVLKQCAHSSWRLSRPCFISLTERGISYSGLTQWRIEIF